MKVTSMSGTFLHVRFKSLTDSGSRRVHRHIHLSPYQNATECSSKYEWKSEKQLGPQVSSWDATLPPPHSRNSGGSTESFWLSYHAENKKTGGRVYVSLYHQALKPDHASLTLQSTVPESRAEPQHLLWWHKCSPSALFSAAATNHTGWLSVWTTADATEEL